MKNLTASLKYSFTLCLLTVMHAAQAQPARDIYEIRVYHINNKSQEAKIDQYLKNAFIPALHRAKILSVGVFKPLETDTAAFGKKIYVFIPFSSLKQYSSIEKTLTKDPKFQESSIEYMSAPFDAPPFDRFETILLQAFTDSPQFNIPPLKVPKSERVYELRSYESATEKLYANKVQMFNLGDEIGLFKKLDFNAVFYGDVLAGSHKPNLMYMTTFNSMTSRDEHWKTFGADPVWKKLSGMPEYQHNVSHADIFLLRPVEYSDL